MDQSLMKLEVLPSWASVGAHSQRREPLVRSPAFQPLVPSVLTFRILDINWQPFTPDSLSWYVFSDGGETENESLAGFAEGMIDFSGRAKGDDVLGVRSRPVAASLTGRCEQFQSAY